MKQRGRQGRLASRPPNLESDPVRARIWAKHESDPVKYSLSAMAKAIGRGHAYVQQYFKRQRPANLPEKERHLLARFLELPEPTLRPEGHPAPNGAPESAVISIGLKNITSNMQKRSCIFRGEMHGLNQINSVLEKHGSEHRIVSWYLPRLCDE
jgi:hypothetical protein